MSDTGEVLSQSEVDALFKQATGKNLASPPAAKPAAPTATSQPPVTPAAPGASPPPVAKPAAPKTPPPPTVTAAPVPPPATTTLQTAVTDLAQRLTKVETAISRLGQKERETTDVSVIVRRLSQRLEAAVRDLQKVNSQVSGIIRGLQATPDYNIRNGFTCESCGSHGFMAISMKCTECGGEGWWGWWSMKE